MAMDNEKVQFLMPVNSHLAVQFKWMTCANGNTRMSLNGQSPGKQQLIVGF